MDPTQYTIAIVGAGPGGLGAAMRAAELGMSHVLLEGSPAIARTIAGYQRGKHVMAHPEVLGGAPYPMRGQLPFAAGTREQVLQGWENALTQQGVNLRFGCELKTISGGKGAFVLDCGGTRIAAQAVVLAIGLQGNPRRLGCPGELHDCVQYQLDDPRAFKGERIAVVGAGDAAIENAVALAQQNQVWLINRREEFDRAKSGNLAALKKAQDEGRVTVVTSASARAVEDAPNGEIALVLSAKVGELRLPLHRVVARLGAMPPRDLVEKGCGVRFASADANALPVLDARYQSSVPGLYVVGALAGCPLIKQAINQGWEVIETIAGRQPVPVDEPYLHEKLALLPGDHGVAGRIAELQARVPLLAPLTALQLREVLLDSTLHAQPAGSTVFKRNDYTDSFFTVLDGSVAVLLDDNPHGARVRLGTGEFFGEMGLISGRRRNATVVADGACVLLETPRKAMTKLLASSPDVKRVLDQTFMVRALAQHLAPDIPRARLQEAAATAEMCRYKAGDVLFTEGEASDALYLIRKGSVTVSRQQQGREVVLAYVPAGQYVGEMALLTGTPRSATVRAAIATEAIRLPADGLRPLLAERREMRQRMEDTMQARVQRNTQTGEQGGGAASAEVQFLLNKGLGEATDVLLIDENLCVGCDQCERACADTHGGVSRLDRAAGPSWNNLHIPTSCRHCEHPHCMKDCPPDAIKRNANGEVFITDACIGCGNCESNCPYGVIQMAVTAPKPPSLWRWLVLGGKEPGRTEPEYDANAAKKAVKCDMCKDLKGGAACVRACPTGAALRVSPETFLSLLHTHRA